MFERVQLFVNNPVCMHVRNEMTCLYTNEVTVPRHINGYYVNNLLIPWNTIQWEDVAQKLLSIHTWRTPHDDNRSPIMIEYKQVLIRRHRFVLDGCKFQLVPQSFTLPAVRALARPNQANRLHGRGRLHFKMCTKQSLHCWICTLIFVPRVGTI